MIKSQIIRLVNIKKEESFVVFCVAVDTGELLSIEAVPKGLCCKCIWSACDTRLEAQRGEEKEFSFAHETNNGCHYGPELSIYRAFNDFLQKNLKFHWWHSLWSHRRYWEIRTPEISLRGTLLELREEHFQNVGYIATVAGRWERSHTEEFKCHWQKYQKSRQEQEGDPLQGSFLLFDVCLANDIFQCSCHLLGFHASHCWPSFRCIKGRIGLSVDLGVDLFKPKSPRS